MTAGKSWLFFIGIAVGSATLRAAGKPPELRGCSLLWERMDSGVCAFLDPRFLKCISFGTQNCLCNPEEGATESEQVQERRVKNKLEKK